MDSSQAFSGEQKAFLEGFRTKDDRDLLGLIEAVGRLKKVQWEALVNMVKVLQND
jgi:hypothetical protein